MFRAAALALAGLFVVSDARGGGSAAPEPIASRLPRGHIVVVKHLASARGSTLVKGEPFTVTWTILNLGDECVKSLPRARALGTRPWRPPPPLVDSAPSPRAQRAATRAARAPTRTRNLRLTLRAPRPPLSRSDATDVVLTDSFPEAMFRVVAGSPTVRVARVDAGANHTATLTVVPLVAGTLTVGSAEVSYGYTVDGEPAEAKSLSSTPGRMEIYGADAFHVRFADHTVALAVAAAAAAALVVVPAAAAADAARARSAPAGKKTA